MRKRSKMVEEKRTKKRENVNEEGDSRERSRLRKKNYEEKLKKETTS